MPPCTTSAPLSCGGATIADVAAKVTPSVVNVFSERRIAPPEASPYFTNPFFRYYFRRPAQDLRQQPVQRERSLGSGVIVSSDGVILTNSHLVERADRVRVALHDGRELEAKVVGSDPPSDVAVLRVKAQGLPALGVADSSRLRTGDLVLAIGDPFGLGQTVTMGIVSATGRANLGITDYEDFIQTDAAINPGNSGGALVDMGGNLVGLNTAIASRSGGYQGIGFAIPSNMVVQVEDAILHHGKVTRGWLGVAVQAIDENLARSLKLEPGHGVLVSDVTPGSPAAKAGIARGDVIVSVDGAPATTPAQLRNLIALAGKGKRVRLAVEHGGTLRRVDVALGELPSDAGAPQTVDQGLFGGVTVQPLDRASRSRLRVPPGVDGVLVARVSPDSPAAEMGLREGDVILQVNQTPTPAIDALRKALQGDQRAVLLLIYRDGTTLYLSLSR
ncbi:MAG TPA: DegQ family serine endoprotease [Kofleriaceae bacterium]